MKKEKRKAVNKAVHEIVDVKYKDYPTTWRVVKKNMVENGTSKAAFIQDLRKVLEMYCLIDMSDP